MFIVIEFQTDASGHVSTIVTQHPTRAEAESKYYTVLAYAAISSVPLHAAMLCFANGKYLMSQAYEHPVVVEEPIVEETTPEVVESEVE